MSTTRRKFSKEFKSKVVLESLKERETLESLAKKYELTPTQISTWHYTYPYLLTNLEIVRCNQVWAMDITYIPMKKGFMYLTAIIDLHSRYVIHWSLSNTMTAEWCAQVLGEAIEKHGKPEIFNTDQGSQFTSEVFINVLKNNEIKISMDGKGRALDTVFFERLWRSVKYENVYLNVYENGLTLWEGLSDYFGFYNNNRLHQSLDYLTSKHVYYNAA
jgi:putative transposase